MQKYRASNQMTFGGFITLLVLAIVAAAALGGVLFAVDYYLHFYLILLFPMFAGGIAGGLLARGVNAGKVRSPFFAFIAGLICGVLMYGVYHAASYYVGFRTDFRAAIVKNAGQEVTDAQFNKLEAAFLQEEVGDTGIMGYLKETAKEGITITNTSYGTTTGTDTLKGNLVWGYYAVEILLAALFAGFIAAGAAGQPFDEDANEWYGPPVLFATADKKSRKDLLNAFKVGDFQQAGALLTQQNIKYPRVSMNIRRSKSGSASQDIYVQLLYATRSNRASTIKKGVITSSDFESLRRGMSQAAANPPPTK